MPLHAQRRACKHDRNDADLESLYGSESDQPDHDDESVCAARLQTHDMPAEPDCEIEHDAEAGQGDCSESGIETRLRSHLFDVGRTGKDTGETRPGRRFCGRPDRRAIAERSASREGKPPPRIHRALTIDSGASSKELVLAEETEGTQIRKLT